jgi:dTDP-4-amino-4,6-dideoxygalactose transaminase
MVNPYKVVEMFEDAIAEYCGSKYAVAVESCTAAIFLSLQYRIGAEKPRKFNGYTVVRIPKHTYPSIPCSIKHSAFNLEFTDEKWEGEYELKPLEIWDAALRFKKNMYHGGFQCLSFHIKKQIKIGRGGAILTDDFEAVKWFRKARFDGRAAIPLLEDNFDMLGWNVYMNPPDAARGLQLLQALGDTELEDLKVEEQGYPDLSKFPIYKQ